MSITTDDDVNARIAARVGALRAERGHTLDALAERSGVSRSAISAIERGAANPTAVVLERLATGLDVPLASLFDGPAARDTPAAAPGPLVRRADQLRWRDPQSGYVRRNVSPPGWPSPIRITEVELPPGATVAYETAERAVVIDQQLWVLAGEVEVTVGDQVHRLDTGDCLAMRVDRPTAFHNPGDRVVRYAVVVTDRPGPRRTA
ncbi:MAG TPA: XRE family transcriptional regulator [Acidimicrobiales bacterium]|jgi:transcriptional regulator with XRE-family HTH domain|nr:XRE family transcriptional regulator [Acidimicrobiales bacterium]